ncbi:MAG: HEAT repeat domain-containing protein [Elusimicrobia bacterium]|nr:HEAT repeat domain-containing protein [Elusimicrobiota bacterium]
MGDKERSTQLHSHAKEVVQMLSMTKLQQHTAGWFRIHGRFRRFAVVCSLALAVLFSLAGLQAFSENKGTDLRTALDEMKSPDASVREAGLRKLYALDWDKLGTRRDEVISSLLRLLKDENMLIRQKAAVTIERIDPIEREETLPVLIEALMGKSEYFRDAASIIGRFGPRAKDAVPAVIEAMKREEKDSLIMPFWVSTLERIGTLEALEAVKPYNQKMERQEKLVRPISMLSDSYLGSSLMTFGFLGLFWWSRVRRKKGDKIISWPLLIPVPFWGICIYNVYYRRSYPPVFDAFFVEIYIFLLVVTLVGIIPWLSSLLWGRMRARPTAPTTP